MTLIAESVVTNEVAHRGVDFCETPTFNHLLAVTGDILKENDMAQVVERGPVTSLKVAQLEELDAAQQKAPAERFTPGFMYGLLRPEDDVRAQAGGLLLGFLGHGYSVATSQLGFYPRTLGDIPQSVSRLGYELNKKASVGDIAHVLLDDRWTVFVSTANTIRGVFVPRPDDDIEDSRRADQELATLAPGSVLHAVRHTLRYKQYDKEYKEQLFLGASDAVQLTMNFE